MECVRNIDVMSMSWEAQAGARNSGWSLARIVGFIAIGAPRRIQNTNVDAARLEARATLH
jgi:hypothetical protein